MLQEAVPFAKLPRAPLRLGHPGPQLVYPHDETCRAGEAHSGSSLHEAGAQAAKALVEKIASLDEENRLLAERLASLRGVGAGGSRGRGGALSPTAATLVVARDDGTSCV